MVELLPRCEVHGQVRRGDKPSTLHLCIIVIYKEFVLFSAIHLALLVNRRQRSGLHDQNIQTLQTCREESKLRTKQTWDIVGKGGGRGSRCIFSLLLR